MARREPWRGRHRRRRRMAHRTVPAVDRVSPKVNNVAPRPWRDTGCGATGLEYRPSTQPRACVSLLRATAHLPHARVLDELVADLVLHHRAASHSPMAAYQCPRPQRQDPRCSICGLERPSPPIHLDQDTRRYQQPTASDLDAAPWFGRRSAGPQRPARRQTESSASAATEKKRRRGRYRRPLSRWYGGARSGTSD